MEATTGAAQAAPLAPTGHSRFGASGAHRWTVCTGSIQAQAGQPNESSEYAAEGTALHAVASQCLEQKQDAAEWIDRKFFYEDHGEQKEIEIDEDQAEAVQTYLDTIRQDQEARGGKLLVETRFQLAHLHPEFFGTCDCCAIGTDNVLRVYDAKFGRGKIVEPWVQIADTDFAPNIQLGFYALGALRALARVLETVDVQHVELVVIQPRAWHREGPVRRHLCSRLGLESLADELVEKAREAETAPQLIAGDHCTFCTASHSCVALRDLAMETAQMDFDDGAPPNPVDLSPEDLAHVLDRADVLQTFISAVRARAHALVDSGRIEIPGWGLKTTQGHRKWGDEAATAAALCFDFGLDESSIYSQKLLSPAQVEKKLPKPERGRLADLLAERSTKTSLVRASNPDATASPRAQSDWNDGLSTPEGSEW